MISNLGDLVSNPVCFNHPYTLTIFSILNTMVNFINIIKDMLELINQLNQIISMYVFLSIIIFAPN